MIKRLFEDNIVAVVVVLILEVKLLKVGTRKDQLLRRFYARPNVIRLFTVVIYECL
jgi:hypothetical protein